MKDIAIFGLGRLGSNLAKTYSDMGGKVIAVDKLQEKIDDIADYVTYAVRADITEESVIRNLGINNVDTVVVAIGKSFEVSIIVIEVCKELGVPYIIAKANNELHGNIFKKIGADEILYPEQEVGIRLANNIAHSGQFMNIAEISKDFTIIETKIPKSWLGKTLVQLNPRKKYGFNVIAMKQNGVFEINIDIDTPFTEDMELVVLGYKEKLEKVFE